MPAILATSTPHLIGVLWGGLGFIGLFGLIALADPKKFASLSSAGGRWIDSSAFLAKLDARFDIDQYILPYTRPFGVVLLASVAVLSWRITLL